VSLADLDAADHAAAANVATARQAVEAANLVLKDAQTAASTVTNESSAKRRQLGAAKARLLKTCPDAEALEVLGKAINEREAIAQKLNAIKQRLGSSACEGVVGAIRELKRQLADLHGDSPSVCVMRVSMQTKLDAFTRERDELQPEADRLTKQLDDAKAAVCAAESKVFTAR
jgi:chromosome segregation ATPase